MYMDAITSSYNFAPTLAEVLTKSAQWFENGRGYTDLGDLNAQMVRKPQILAILVKMLMRAVLFFKGHPTRCFLHPYDFSIPL